MRILITAGPTHEPIDAVRYIANRSTGKMGAALAKSALRAGHHTTMILGPVSLPIPPDIHRIDIVTAQQMFDAVMSEFPTHDLLIMAAAVADYRPMQVERDKLARQDFLAIQCEATPDIVAAASAAKRPDQRVVGFSLESPGDIDRAHRKLLSKNLDLIVYNPLDTMASDNIQSTLLYPDGRDENLPSRTKAEFADILIQRAVALFA
jgi:phosphopantothenoylcysteine decarboxylase/phosphopantothenate--cysteine ligase